MAAIVLAGSQLANAAVIIDIYQQGSDVVSTASGTVDTTDLNPLSGSPFANSLIWSKVAFVTDGPATSDLVSWYSGLSGPSSFGPSNSTNYATSGTGDRVGIYGSQSLIYLPLGYASDTPLTASATWAGKTISGLGLTLGTYKYTWGTGADADSLTVNIGPLAPLPSTLASGSAGLVLLAGWAWRQRRFGEAG